MRIPLLFAVVACTATCSEDVTTPTESEPQEAPSIPAAATAWLDREAVPLHGTNLELPHDDLEPLRVLVGDARIVSLGENTHGTRDFFEMKARMLRFLVEEMGFDAFAIEASWPEANRLDTYVRTGVGDPLALLSGLYFWTWNTQSVLEMIEWMRSHNEAGGDVGFYGFDMQFPGMALRNFTNFVETVDLAGSTALRDGVSCLSTYANGPGGSFQGGRYADQASSYRSACRASLLSTQQALVDREAAYTAASSADAYSLARQSLRVAIQYEAMQSGIQSRDQSMAENASWLSNRLGSGGKLVLWAHNLHVADRSGAMGSWLRDEFGDDMVIVGFSHGSGRFTAIRQVGSTFQGRSTENLSPALSFSYEHYFDSAELPRYILDLRGVAESDSTAWLEGPRPGRFIGCCYDPSLPSNYWTDSRLPQWYDLLIHIDQTRETTVFPYRPPEVF